MLLGKKVSIFDLKGKVAIVTGAARGIGQGIALELARQGADVVVSDIIPGDDTVTQIKKMKRKSVYMKTDISSEKDVMALISQTVSQFGKLDILVNNAGIFMPGDSTQVTEEDWEKTIHVNLKGTFFCCREAIKVMKPGSSIINISSVAGMAGYSQGASYCASKGGIRLLTKELAAEFGSKGIRINSVHPGVIETPMTMDLLKDPKMREGTLAKIPLKRTGQPADIAGPVAFLASDAAAYMTGAEVVADGGWIASL